MRVHKNDLRPRSISGAKRQQLNRIAHCITRRDGSYKLRILNDNTISKMSIGPTFQNRISGESPIKTPHYPILSKETASINLGREIEGWDKFVSNRDYGESQRKGFECPEQPEFLAPDNSSALNPESIARSPPAAEMIVLWHRVGIMNVTSIERRRVEKSRTNSL